MENREAEYLQLKGEIDKLKKELAIYKATVDHLNEGVHVVDKEGRTIVYNSAMERLEGLQRENIVHKKLLEVLPTLNAQTSTMLTVLRTSQPLENVQQSYFNAKGKKITTVNSTLPIYHKNEMIGALEISRDLTSVNNLSEEIHELRQELFSQKEKISAKDKIANNTRFTLADIISKNEKMQEVIVYAMRASRSSSTVLLVGETGTGKELFAQGIHNASPRYKQPFIAQNCAALPDSLLEGILFGTSKGGFTGAVDRPGLFEQANGGTLLLDEVNSMDVNLQAKLLRVLQEGYVRRVGDTKDIRVNVRVLATINVDPLQTIKEKKIREDLYYRLSVVSIYIPPLRERKEDIILLINYFIAKYNKQLNLQVEDISDEVREFFLDYHWPGNVRELEHVIEGSMNMITHENIISLFHLPFSYQNSSARLFRNSIVNIKPLDLELDSFECNLLQKALKTTGGNITKTAKVLGITRQALQYKIKKYQLGERKGENDFVES